MQVKADAELEERACTPLRPAYAQDVRDPAVVAANATDKLLSENVTFFGSATQVGLCGRPSRAAAAAAVVVATWLLPCC